MSNERKGVMFEVNGGEIIAILQKRIKEMRQFSAIEEDRLGRLRREPEFTDKAQQVSNLEMNLKNAVVEIEGVEFLADHVNPDRTFELSAEEIRSFGFRIPFELMR